MADTFTETTTQSYGSRLKDSLAGVLVGLVLFFGSFALLFWNEDNSVKTYRAISEMEKNVITVEAAKVVTANDGKLVCMNGDAVTSDILKDKLTNLAMKGIALNRQVEMYQWVETKHSETKEKAGGSTETVTTYTYDKQWSSSYRDSGGFKKPEGHANPVMKYSSKLMLAENVRLGAFKLTANMIGRIGGEEEYNFSVDNKSKLPADLKTRAVLNDGILYLGKSGKPSVDSPKVGDYRIKYSLTGPKKPVTVMAKQAGNTFSPYVAKNGKTFEILKDGLLTSADVIQMERTANAILTWILRFVGFLCMFIGLQLLVNPLRTLLAVLPFLAQLFGALTGVVLFLISIVLTLVTIAIAWIVVRPVAGITLLVLAGGAVFAMIKMKKKEPAAQAPSAK
jgi:hypothetical protein